MLPTTGYDDLGWWPRYGRSANGGWSPRYTNTERNLIHQARYGGSAPTYRRHRNWWNPGYRTFGGLNEVDTSKLLVTEKELWAIRDYYNEKLGVKIHIETTSLLTYMAPSLPGFTYFKRYTQVLNQQYPIPQAFYYLYTPVGGTTRVACPKQGPNVKVNMEDYTPEQFQQHCAIDAGVGGFFKKYALPLGLGTALSIFAMAMFSQKGGQK